MTLLRLTIRLLIDITQQLVDVDPVWLSDRVLRQQRKRLWVRFPGNTHTDENV